MKRISREYVHTDARSYNSNNSLEFCVEFPQHEKKTMTPNPINLVISWFDLNDSDDVWVLFHMRIIFLIFTVIWCRKLLSSSPKLEQILKSWVHLYTYRVMRWFCWTVAVPWFPLYSIHQFTREWEEKRQIGAQSAVSSILIVSNEQLSLYWRRFRVRNLFLCYQDLT